MGSDAVDKAIQFRQGQLLVSQEAEGYHVYSNGDLFKMFQVANVQYKALIALATSSGFSIAQLMKLDKAFIKAHIERARDNNERFIYIPQIRKKTNVKGLLVINPLAIEWLSKWIDQNPSERLFTCHEDAVNVMLKKLAKRSQIKLTGKIRFHNIRAWVMSSLSHRGLNTFQIKYHLAKKIQNSDATYLKTLAMEIKEKYETTDLYSKLCLTQASIEVRSKDAELKEVNEELETLRKIMVSMIGKDKLAKLVEQPQKQKSTIGITKGTIHGAEISTRKLLELYAKSLESESNE